MKGKRSTPLTLEESLCLLYRKAYPRLRGQQKVYELKKLNAENRFYSLEELAKRWKVSVPEARKSVKYLTKRSYVSVLAIKHKPAPGKPVMETLFYNFGPHNLWLRATSKRYFRETLGAKAEKWIGLRKPRHRKANEFNQNPRYP